MFIGHYGVSLAAKRFAPRASLGVLFVAVQLLDVVFMTLLLLGVEKMRLVPGFTKVTPYDLYFVPYSHSLAGAVLWSALAALACAAIVSKKVDAKVRVTTALVIAFAVLSHFLLDAPMHVPDLPLGFDADATKIGLGLWNQVDVTIALEVGILVAGGALYLGSTKPLPGGATAAWVLGIILVVLAVATPFMPTPPTTAAFAAEALGGYAALAALAEWTDRKRAPVKPSI